MMLGMLMEFLGVTIGVLLTALGLDMFLIPNKIAAGGVSGIATVLYHVFHIPVGVAILCLNVPLFLFGLLRLGLPFGFRSLYGTIALSVLVDLLGPYLPVVTNNSLLASVFGGVLVGLGLGLTFRFKGTTGGTDLAAAILRTYTGANVGQLLFMVDALVVVAAGFAFHSWELAMYALIGIFVTAWMIDWVQGGMPYAKVFLVISEHSECIAKSILKQIKRGVTALKAEGMYTKTEKNVLLVVVHRSEVSLFKELVYELDPQAFVIMADIQEVLGKGFRPLRQ